MKKIFANIAIVHFPVFVIPFLVEREGNVIGFTIVFCLMGLAVFYIVCFYGFMILATKENKEKGFWYYFFKNNLLFGICLLALITILITIPYS